jgi:signal transduction histidine kinase
MLQILRNQLQPQVFAAADPTRQWVGSVGLAVAVGVAYFLAARLSLALLVDGVAVFWPAAGVAAGVLIALGPRARLSVAAGTMAATIVANLLGDRNLSSTVIFALSNAGEAVLTAWLLERYFGSDFNLGRLSHVLGLVAAAIVGTAVSGIGGIVGFKLFQGSTAPIGVMWQHWVASDALGIVTVAPLVIGLVAIAREPLSRSELTEGVAAVAALTLMSGFVISLPAELLATVVPVALLFPPLLWLAARCRPVFAAAAVFIVSLTIVWATTFGVGQFGNAGRGVAERALPAQASILLVALGALVLAALFTEIRDQSRLLAEGSKHKSQFLANMSHELRTPLNAILGYTELILDNLYGETPDKMRKVLDRIQQNGKHLLDLINDVLDLSKIEAGQLTLSLTDYSLKDVVHNVFTAVEPLANEKKLALKIEVQPDLPLGHADERRMTQVLLNLIGNAIKFTDAGGITVRTTASKGSFMVAVEDTGPGISASDQSRIFEEFQQADSSATKKKGGTGLGLSIARRIVEMQGGRLWVESKLGEGSTFFFTLPVNVKMQVSHG